MNDLEQKEKCMKCEHARAVHTNRETGARITFIGCDCPPYKGKWTAEIKECPKINKPKLICYRCKKEIKDML